MKKVLALLLAISFLFVMTTATPMLSSVTVPVRAQAASAEIVAPSFTSGEDFATVELGNAWDMDSTGDIDPVWTKDESSTTDWDGEVTYTVDNGIATIVTDDTGNECKSPAPHRPLALNLGGKTIEADKYKYLTMRYKMDSPINGPCGSVFRIRWMYTNIWAAGRTDDHNNGAWRDGAFTDDTVLRDNAWHTYSLDLSEAPLAGEMADWGLGLRPNVFQIMVHEAHWSWTSHLDWVKLTAENTASSSYNVQWNLVDGSGVLTTTIYWATEYDKPGTVIEPGYVVPTQTQGISVTSPYTNQTYLPLVLNRYAVGAELDAEFSYSVGTDGLTDGESYYIAIKLKDASSTSWTFSLVPVKKISN
ncbi:MAG: hypothetical protein JXA89_04980 [Anaerolineae bacterium]|nr:hypothetical protein [Anaerolineae bacterium]